MNKRKSKGMFFCISMHLFPYDVHFSIDEEDYVLFSRLKKISMTDFDPLMMKPTTQGRTLITNRGTTIIRLKKHPTNTRISTWPLSILHIMKIQKT